MPRLTYQGVTAAIYAGVQREAMQRGISMQGVGGTTSTHGCTFNYAYNAPAQALMVDLVSKPWLYPEQTVMGQLDHALRDALRKAGWRG